MAHVERPQHPDISNDMFDKIDEIIAVNRPRPGSIITALRECQDIAGYLPVELIDYISHGMNIAPSEVFGIASFYALFSMEPRGRHTIKMCLGTACYVKGVKQIMSRIHLEYGIGDSETTEDRRFSLEAVRCLGACGLAPVMIVDKDTYGALSSDRAAEILEKYE